MSRLTLAPNLKFLEVIMSDRFVHGTQHTPLYGSEPVKVGFDKPYGRKDKTDPTRAQAKFLVLSVRLARLTEAFGGSGDVWTEVTCVRLKDDGSFDPGGEVISFPADGYAENVIREVTLVGTMTLSFQPSE